MFQGTSEIRCFELELRLMGLEMDFRRIHEANVSDLVANGGYIKVRLYDGVLLELDRLSHD